MESGRALELVRMVLGGMRDVLQINRSSMSLAINKHVVLFPSPAQTGHSAMFHVAVEPKAARKHARMETGATHVVQYRSKRSLKHVMYNNVIVPQSLEVILFMKIVATLVTVLKHVGEEQNIVLEHAKTDNGAMRVAPVNNSIDTKHAVLRHVARHLKSVQTLVLVVHLVVVELNFALEHAKLVIGEANVVLLISSIRWRRAMLTLVLL